jgi:hypothetical protein
MQGSSGVHTMPLLGIGRGHMPHVFLNVSAGP